MANGNADDDRAPDVGSPEAQVFTPETDALIDDIGMLSQRFTVSPFMFAEPSVPDPRIERRRKRSLRDTLVALRDRLRRR